MGVCKADRAARSRMSPKPSLSAPVYQMTKTPAITAST